MTVANDTRKNSYIGNGAATSWPFTFKAFDPADVEVWIKDANGNNTKLASGYQVNLNSDGNGGSVVYPYPSGTSLPNTNQITIVRNVPMKQEMDLVNQGPFFAEVIEEALDRAIVIDQQQQEKLDRALVIPVTVSGVDPSLPTPVPLHSIRWNAAGNGLETTLDPATVVEAATAQRQLAETARAGSEDARDSSIAAKNEAQRIQGEIEQEVNDVAMAAVATIQADITASKNAAAIYATDANASKVAAGISETAAANSANVANLAAQANHDLAFATKAAMDADLAHAANITALVTNDPTASNNGIYIKLGASGAGSWQKSAYIPPVVNGSVTLDALTFKPLIGVPGKNLFNKATIIADHYLSGSGFADVLSGYWYSDYIAVLPSTVYTKSGYFNVCFYTSGKVFISSSTDKKTFTTPDNCAYVRVSDSSNINTFQLEKGPVETEYEVFAIKLDKNTVPLNVIDNSMLSFYAMEGLASKNLFDKAMIVTDHYLSGDGGSVALAGFWYSNLIPVEPSTAYTKTGSFNVCCYTNVNAFISSIADVKTFTTPANCFFIRVSDNVDVNTFQLEKGSIETFYDSFDPKLPFDNVAYAAYHNFEILLPSDIYLVSGESFSIYYRNIIKYSQAFEKGNFYIRGQQKNGDGSYSQKGNGYPYKWEYTPSGAETFQMEFRIIETFTQKTMAKKVVTFHVSSVYSGRSANIITIGDSFTDGYGITAYMHDFTASKGGGNTLNCIGLNDGGVPGVKDDAWSGESYAWYASTATGYLRSDRPLSDAVWDTGWGQGEINGWTVGQTYADLTPTQRSHGYTKNEFWNGSAFDFAHFMSTYFPTYVPHGTTGNHIDAFVSFLGFNDCILHGISSLNADLVNSIPTMINSIINSVLAWDPQIKVLLHTVPPQPSAESEKFINEFGIDFKSSERSKYAQEIWNSFMLTTYDTAYWKSRGVYIIPTAAHFDSRFGTLTGGYTPDKFNLSYVENLTNDIHPSPTGAKYLADAMWMALYNLVLHS